MDRHPCYRNIEDGAERGSLARRHAAKFPGLHFAPDRGLPILGTSCGLLGHRGMEPRGWARRHDPEFPRLRFPFRSRPVQAASAGLGQVAWWRAVWVVAAFVAIMVAVPVLVATLAPMAISMTDSGWCPGGGTQRWL
eukprot:11097670-Alexandrium_andersonii.AAC.1